jgi:quinol monooxygenase YgiN
MPNTAIDRQPLRHHQFEPARPPATGSLRWCLSLFSGSVGAHGDRGRRNEGDNVFAVITTVEVEQGSIPELASLFEFSNRELVAGHQDWLGAWFTANHARSEVTVIARWSNADSYERLRTSDGFQEVMSQFAAKFVRPPSVSINEILVEM